MFHILSPESIQHLIQTYGLWILFSVVMLESMGVPMPGETALVATGLYAGATHGIPIEQIILVAALAAITGDNLGYMIGRSLGFRLLERLGRYVRLSEARLKIGQYLFLRHGGKIVFFGRFVAILRVFSAAIAGANRMPWRHFLAMNGLGGIIWASLFGIGPYLFGNQIKVVTGPLNTVLLLGAVVAVIVAVRFFLPHERELEARAEAALSAHRNRYS